jgi:hypothetical protein
MQLQFSLRRAFIAGTLLCAALARMHAFPRAAISIALALLPYGPALLVVLIAAWASQRKWTTGVVVVTGGLIGCLLTPTMMVNWRGLPSFWDVFLVDFQTTGLGTAAGAICFAAMDAWLQPRRSSGLSPSSLQSGRSTR